jgi:uracil-DNA glycosylase family 4
MTITPPATTIVAPLYGAAAHDAEVQRVAHNWRHSQRGDPSSPILVLCDAPSIEAARSSLPMDMDLHKMWAQMSMEAGLGRDDFYFVGLCPPIPRSVGASKKKEWEFIQPYVESVRQIIAETKPELVVVTGNNALRALAGKALAITKNRGTFHDFKGIDCPVFPMLSPKMISIQPDNRPIMEADLNTLGRMKTGFWDTSTLRDIPTDYQWCFDLQFMLDNKPGALAIDVEATGLDTLAPDYRVITVQLTSKAGQSYVCRVCADYKPDHPLFKDQTEADIARLRGQIKQLVEDGDIKKIGQNFKYDFKALRSMGMEACSWDWDTELMARFVNENFMTYSLDDMVRVYVPAMSGYADHFNQTIDKSRMIDVEPEDMLPYAGGDTDATWRLAQALKPLLTRDPANLNVMRVIHQRALVAFTKTVETAGFTFDTAALDTFDDELTEHLRLERMRLIRMVPPKVRRKYLADKKGFSLSRADCVRDTLFGHFTPDGQFHKGDGFGLKPSVFTPATTNEQDPSKKLPSTSTKDHLPYFIHEQGAAGVFVNAYSEYAKATKMMDTYVKGFRHVMKDGETSPGQPAPRTVIIPQYNFRTNTKRTNSTDPNGQNFPKRGRWAKHFRRLIIAPPGKMLIASDLSQAELRIAAWMANEREMLRIYSEDGDIHMETAAMVIGMAVEELLSKGKPFYKPMRQNAKATNFGYIYGAFPKTYMQVAKTQYGVDVTLKEAEAIREVYFAKYKDLPIWHEETKKFARENGYVKSLHGLTRHLPSVWSTDFMVQGGAERNSVNSPVQNFGSDLGVMALTRLAAQADHNLIRPVGFIHDQLIAEVDENYYIEGMGWLKWVMENPLLEQMFGLVPPLPIKSDPEWGRNLADSTELADADPAMIAAVAEHTRKPDWWEDDEEAVWDRYARDNRVPDYTIRDVTGEMQRNHLILH